MAYTWAVRAVVHGALAEVPRIEVRTDDDGVGRAAGQRGDDVGGFDLLAMRAGVKADADGLAALEQAAEPEALFLGDIVHRDLQRLALERAGAGEELAAVDAVDPENGLHAGLDRGLLVLAARDGSVGREEADLAAES